MAVIVKYKGAMHLWYANTTNGKAKLVTASGKKFSGTPAVDKLEIIRKKLVHFDHNGTQYVITKQGVFSCATGKIMDAPSILEAADTAIS